MRRSSRSLVALAVALPLLALLPTAYAAPGDLDRTFSQDGVVTTSIIFGPGNDSAYDVAVQPDGKVAAAGFGEIFRDGNRQRAFAVVRYNASGAPDHTFGGDGIVFTDISAERDEARSLAVQPDGKVVVGGFSTSPTGGSYDFTLVRYRPDGSLDPTFGTMGVVTTDFKGNGFFEGDVIYSIELQPDGRILAGGSTTSTGDTDFAVARYLPDGSLDPSFDGDGKVTTSLAGRDELTGLALQADGRIVAAGSGFLGGSCSEDCFDWQMVRYNSDGSLDTSFAADGTVVTDAPVDLNRAEDLALQPDARIVAVGSSGGDFAVARYQPDGTLDPSFSGDGIAVNDVAKGLDELNAVAIQPDGKVLVAGTSFPDGSGGFRDFAVARYEAHLCPGVAIDNTIIGTPGDDVLTGTAGNDLILGYSGNDVINGGGGADCIQGGPGDDTVKGGFGADQLFGEGGDDALNGGPDADRITGGLGRDSILAKTGDDVVLVAAGDVPPAQIETIDGGATPGTDTLRLGKDIGANHVVGSPPNFSVVDPATGGTYSVTDVERTKDSLL